MRFPPRMFFLRKPSPSPTQLTEVLERRWPVSIGLPHTGQGAPAGTGLPVSVWGGSYGLSPGMCTHEFSMRSASRKMSSVEASGLSLVTAATALRASACL